MQLCTVTVNGPGVVVVSTEHWRNQYVVDEGRYEGDGGAGGDQQTIDDEEEEGECKLLRWVVEEAELATKVHVGIVGKVISTSSING